MYPNQTTLAQEVKREVLAELQPVNTPQLNNPVSGDQGQGGNLPFASEQTYQTVKNSVKNEVLAEIQRQQLDKTAQLYGLDRSLSDQRIQQLVDARLRTVDNLRTDIKKELLALQTGETLPAGDPHTRQIAATLAEEARRQGISREQLVQTLEQKNTNGNGLSGRILEMLNTGQSKGFLSGIGATLLCQFVILPLLRGNMRSVAVRSMEEGMAIVDRAKNLVSGQQQQGTPQQPPPVNFSPIPEPPGETT